MRFAGRPLTLALWAAGGLAGASTPVPAAEDRFQAEVLPLLQKYCLSCHAGEKPKGELSLERFVDGKSAWDARETWDSVLEKLVAREMPPEGKPRPTEEEYARFIHGVEQTLGKEDCNGPRNPGRVTLRRLNRQEYNHTIRDLVGVEFQPANDFPSDDVGYGFDNIGDVLSLPPLLLEKYLLAAQQVAEAAIRTEPPVRSLFKARGSELRLEGGEARERGRVVFSSNGQAVAEVDLPADADYVLRVRAFAQQAGDEVARLALRVDGQEVHVLDVKATEESPQLYEARVRIAAGRRQVAVAFVNDYYRPDDPNPANRDRNLIVASLEVLAPDGYPASHRRLIPRDPTPESRAALAREGLERFASRAFRRPVTASELERLLKLVALAEQEGDSFEAGMKLALQAVLVSPHFLFRVELDPPPGDPPAVRTLSDFELATRLSYFLWSSLPDDELFELAQRGGLRTGETLSRQVRRMLADGKSQALVENFAGQWLQLRSLKSVFPNRRQFRGFDQSLRQAMQTETEMFFAHVMRDDRSVLDFLDGKYSFVNERLARHYGLSDVRGSEFRRIELRDDRRAGVLTHASVLTVTSNPTRTSPVKRGKWVLDNLLGTPPPPPPPNVPELEEKPDGPHHGTLRQRMEQHRQNPDCASCHSRMDPLGFGLENFNAVGAWREKDGEEPIDASGTLPDGATFDGPAGLRQVLLDKKEQFVRCLAEKMLTYALGRGLSYDDRCTVDDLVQKVEREEYRFSSLVLGIVESDAFQKRRGKGESP
jgi:hypothetical protein